MASQLIKNNFTTPLFKIYFKKLRVLFKRIDSNDIKLFGTKLDISHFETDISQSYVKELSLLSKLSIVQNYSIEHNWFSEIKLDNEKEIEDKQNTFLFKEFLEKEVQFNAHIKLTPDGNKTILMAISDLKLLVHLEFILNLFNFVMFDDSLSGPLPPIKKCFIIIY